MNNTKTKTRATRAPKKKRATRERQTTYTVRNANGKQPSRPARAKKLVVEMHNGERYEYYPLGKYVVAAPGVCGGQLTFKYTRIRVNFILHLLASGRSIPDLVESYQQSNLTQEAIREAIDLARRALNSSRPAARLAA